MACPQCEREVWERARLWLREIFELDAARKMEEMLCEKFGRPSFEERMAVPCKNCRHTYGEHSGADHCASMELRSCPCPGFK